MLKIQKTIFKSQSALFWRYFGRIFTAGFRCRVPDCDQAEASDYSSFSQFLAVETVDLADRCKMPVFEKWVFWIKNYASLMMISFQFSGQCNGGTFKMDNASTFCNREDLIFDQSIVTRSLVEDFGFVCGKWVNVLMTKIVHLTPRSKNNNFFFFLFFFYILEL